LTSLVIGLVPDNTILVRRSDTLSSI